MTGRDHQIVVCMLKLGELLYDAVGMMFVDEGDCAYYGCIRFRRLFGDQAVANEITESFGTAGVSQPGYKIVEAIKKIGIEGNSDSAESTHGPSFKEKWASMGKIKNSTISEFVARTVRCMTSTA
jgi:hypothetical protein